MTLFIQNLEKESGLKTLGEILNTATYFPPFLILAFLFVPLVLLSMLERLSPEETLELVQSASEKERPDLLQVVCARKGRPYRFDLMRLALRMTKAASCKSEDEALERLRSVCGK